MKRPQIQRIRDQYTSWLRHSIDLLFPPRCAGCNVTGTVWCEECHGRIHPPKGRSCPACGLPLEKGNICSLCTDWEDRVQIRAFAQYEKPLNAAILKLKYRPDQALASEMATWLVGVFRRMRAQADCVVPVPLADVRLRQRGYNQVTLIAVSFAGELEVPIYPRALLRIRDTPSQVGLDRIERHQNVEGAFLADPDIVRGQSIVLIDDLLTSGATMKNCAIALLVEGAAQVFCLSIGRA